MERRPTRRQMLLTYFVVITLLSLIIVGAWFWEARAGVLAIGLTVIGVLLWWFFSIILRAGRLFWQVLTQNKARAIAFALAIGLSATSVLFWWLWGVLVDYV